MKIACAQEKDPISYQETINRATKVTWWNWKIRLNREFGHIEISLRGSERGPYGFIYVPEGHTAAYETFLYEADKNDPPLTYTKLDHVEGRWFYFESKP